MTAFKLIKEIRSSGGDITCQDGKIIIDAHPDYLNGEVQAMLKQEKQTLLKILEIEALAQQIRANHEENSASELSKLFSTIIKNSPDLDAVTAWLKFIINTDSTLEMITCSGCEHSTTDKMGDGATNGSCGLGITWTGELNAQLCKQYSKLMS